MKVNDLFFFNSNWAGIFAKLKLPFKNPRSATGYTWVCMCVCVDVSALACTMI